MGDMQPDPLALPTFLKRDDKNKAEFMPVSDVEVEVESRPAKTVKPKVKANGAGKPTDRPKVKAAPKAAKAAKSAPRATAKAAKGAEKAKVAKPKTEKDVWGLRKGSAKSEAAAMYARKNGATLAEVKERVGSIQLNVLHALEKAGYTVEKEKHVREGHRPVTRYKLLAK